MGPFRETNSEVNSKTFGENFVRISNETTSFRLAYGIGRSTARPTARPT